MHADASTALYIAPAILLATVARMRFAPAIHSQVQLLILVPLCYQVAKLQPRNDSSEPERVHSIDARRCNIQEVVLMKCKGIHAQRCEHTRSCMMAIVPRGVVRVSPAKFETTARAL